MGDVGRGTAMRDNSLIHVYGGGASTARSYCPAMPLLYAGRLQTEDSLVLRELRTMHDVSSGLGRTARDATTLDMQASVRRSVNSPCVDHTQLRGREKQNKAEQSGRRARRAISTRMLGRTPGEEQVSQSPRRRAGAHAHSHRESPHVARKATYSIAAATKIEQSGTERNRAEQSGTGQNRT